MTKVAYQIAVASKAQTIRGEREVAEDADTEAVVSDIVESVFTNKATWQSYFGERTTEGSHIEVRIDSGDHAGHYVVSMIRAVRMTVTRLSLAVGHGG